VTELGERLDVPFVVDNDVNLAALGHAWKGDARGWTDFVVLSLGTGIGAAVVTDGRLLYGRTSAAGEVGYMVLDHAQLASPRPHDLGAFEVLASGVGVAETARTALAAGRGSSLRDTLEGPSSREVFEAASGGDALATAVVDAMVDHVAMAIIAISSVTDPAVIILDGSVGRALSAWIPRISELVADHLPTPPEVVVSTLGGEATAYGAVAAALDLSRSSRGARGSSRVGDGVIRSAAGSTV
jgi:glucokinase